ncbi:DR2241 family protein [Luteolibacter arcticus]|uniref:DR2241 family protein n=1 Tax=Luteolibacter arcticus TaxID=1581411 RepID=A0ABT3GLJ6_9BACT|nr:DR2241 family protein [Luteolibacter arcticus]MCW1924397.1 DR2241 family protein [Luteolibacter arcticus]
MKLAERLSASIAGGIRHIGQVSIRPQDGGYLLCHIDDEGNNLALLEEFSGPAAARDVSTWAEDGHYRFTKGELSLKRGWLLRLSSAEELLQALDLFYPAAAGLWFAQQDGRLEIEHLRDKLNRQTGMYRFARNLSDAGAQHLVRDVCGPGNCCVKKILWQLDADTPLEDSEASRFDGVVGEIDRSRAIPLLCREACNHFVAEARKASKAEHDAKAAG